MALAALFVLASCSDDTGQTANQTAEPTSAGRAAVQHSAKRVALDYLGSTVCAECHQAVFEAWQGSHHQLAMQNVDDGPVLGDFDNASLRHFEDRSDFLTDDGIPVIETPDAHGDPAIFPVTHVFGIEPLQQYLVEFPGGRYQIPAVAWDARSKQDGGQRWFHLYPDDPLPPGDPLHWTGPLQNWNSQCAECHSTGLEKNFNAEANTYDTQWQEISVGCEACHGRGSQHVAWARDPDGAGRRYGRNQGLELTLGSARSWVMNVATGIAERQPALARQSQPEACARCHARRAATTDDYLYGRPLLDTHRLALIEPNLYFPDGQILDEVYVYGSFLQSAMYQAGVECADCHDPHSAKLKVEGDAVCAQCHLPTRFASTDHHRHEPAQVACVDCHMRERNYMVVDGRRDHSFRVPRPDLSDALESPNACSDCHSDQSAGWASARVAEWYPQGRHTQAHYGTALHAAWTGAQDGPARAAVVATDTTQPAIVRASALLSLRGQVTVESAYRAILDGAKDAEAIVRFAAMQALTGLPADAVVPVASSLLSDRVRGVRIEAARIAAVADGQFPAAQQQAFDRAAQELLSAERFNFDRDFGYLNAGNFNLARGKPAEAERIFRAGIKAFPDTSVLVVNLADALRVQGRDDEGIDLLEGQRAVDPKNPAVRESLALAYVRVNRHGDAVTELREMVRILPDQARPGALLVLTLDAVGETGEAERLLEQLRQRFPDDAMVQSLRLGE
jgi:predicted CXXCH cytochrome family protein